MAKRKSKKRHCIRTKMTRKGRRCAAYASTGLSGDLGDLGRVARVITIPGRGVRCMDERGKFTQCLAGDIGDMGDLGRIRPRRVARRTARRTTRRRGLGEYISGKGYRCRNSKGQFAKCR